MEENNSNVPSVNYNNINNPNIFVSLDQIIYQSEVYKLRMKSLKSFIYYLSLINIQFLNRIIPTFGILYVI